MPRFSIIITCYNQSALIRDAVDSALAQGYADKEIIVVDDGSTDGSKNVLEEYGGAIKLKALETNEGVVAARNRGASLAGGDFLCFLDGDDLLLPWALDVYGRIIDFKNPKLIVTRMLWFKGILSPEQIGEKPRGIEFVEYEAFMKKDRAVRSTATTVVDRQSFNHVGGWTPGFLYLDDCDFLIKLGYSGRTIQIVTPKTIAYRMHAGNTTHQVGRMIDTAFKLIQKEKSGRYPGGRACRFERYAVIGGVVFYWLKRAVKMNFYGKGFKLLAAGWPMIFAAVFRRCAVILRGRRPVETLPIG